MKWYSMYIPLSKNNKYMIYSFHKLALLVVMEENTRKESEISVIICVLKSLINLKCRVDKLKVLKEECSVVRPRFYRISVVS